MRKLFWSPKGILLRPKSYDASTQQSHILCFVT